MLANLIIGVVLVGVGFVLPLSCLFIFVTISNRMGKAAYDEFRSTGKKRDFIRTPDERFENLAGYNFAPHYVEIDGLRVHYLDEGPSGADPVLLMHGEPTWSYLYRKMIPPLTERHRVIVPDLIGFGRSDKLVRRRDYSYQMHVDVITAFIKKINLHKITLFCQDWGGLIGLRVAAENQERFDRIIASNTALPGIRPSIGGKRPPLLPLKYQFRFLLWLIYSQLAPKMRISAIVQYGTVAFLTPEVLAGYDAPFPDRRFLAGARVFPVLVPSQLRENAKAWELLCKWEKPFLTAFSDKDAVLGGGDKIFQQLVPGAKNQLHATIRNAGHFLQEDKSEQIATLILEFINKR